MARLVYGDLFVNFTIGANSVPTQTQVGNLITHYYKLAYNLFYGPENYSSDETTDTDSIIDTDDFRSLLNTIISYKVQRWNEAGKNSDGTVRPMPAFDFQYDEGKDNEERNKWRTALANLATEDSDVEFIDTVQWIGSEYGDWEGIYY